MTIQNRPPQASAPHVLTALADPLTYDAGLEQAANAYARLGTDAHFLLLAGEPAPDQLDQIEFQFA